MGDQPEEDPAWDVFEGGGNPETSFLEFAERFADSMWFPACRMVLELSETSIDEFKRGLVTEEDMFQMIKNRHQIDRQFLYNHRGRMQESVRQQIENLGSQLPSVKLMRSAIYGIIRNLSVRDRANFCIEELHTQPPELREIPIDSQLKVEMMHFWWENIAERSAGALRDLQAKAEEFFKNNPGSEAQLSKVVIGTAIFAPNNVIVERH